MNRNKIMNENEELYILWTNGEYLTSKHMLMMYAINAMYYEWWGSITVIIWGASAKLIAENEDIRSCIKSGIEAGVKFCACVACADNLGVQEELKIQGIKVMPMGMPLTDIIKQNKKLITI